MSKTFPTPEPMPALRSAVSKGRTKRRAGSLRAISALILREMTATYGRSPGGYVWAFLEPIGAIAMFTLIISAGLRLREPSIGTSFQLFFATGVLPFFLYRSVSNKVAAALTYSRTLLLYPSVMVIDAIAARFILQVLTNCAVFVICMGGIIMLFDTRALISLPPILASLAMAATLGLGIGTIHAVLFSLFPLWKSVWGILTTPLLFMSTVIYAYEDLPAFGREVLWWNPLVHIIGMMRRGIYGIYDASWASPLYVVVVSGVLFAMGLVLLGRYQRSIINQEFA